MRGVLNVNKPSGITSYDVIRRLKPVLDTRQLGHAGTLDPLATGVLLVLVNEATKVADYLQMLDKEYRAEVRLGIRTDTDDMTGQTIEEKPVGDVRADAVEAILARFRGEIEQTPPAFSAVKVAGDRSYRLARKGEAPEHKPRLVTVHELELVGLRMAAERSGLRGQGLGEKDGDFRMQDAECRMQNTGQSADQWPVLTLRAKVSRGTYIRALARDIGAALGCGATLQSLVRTRVGAFTVQDAVLLDAPDIVRRLIPIGTALSFLPNATVKADAVGRLRSGQALANDEVRMTNDDCGNAARGELLNRCGSPIVVQDEAQRVLVIARYTDGKLRPKRGIYADA
jgi:tRNA pseudouridine55 synthase